MASLCQRLTRATGWLVNPVEYLIDDGTGLMKAVLWNAPDRADVGLGDLVEVEGKLNANTSFEGADPCVDCSD